MNSLHVQFLMLMFAGWVNRSQQQVIEYLQAENRVLREQVGRDRILFTDGQRRRLATKAKVIGRRRLATLGRSVSKVSEHATGVISVACGLPQLLSSAYRRRCDFA